MPTYEYECKKCGRVFDHFQSMSSPVLTVCPESICAEKGEVKRYVGAGSGLIFKGSGFYITDYKKKTGSPSSEGGSDSKGGDSKGGESKSGDSKGGESKSEGSGPGSGGDKAASAPAAPAASSGGSSGSSGSSGGSSSSSSGGSGSGSSGSGSGSSTS